MKHVIVIETPDDATISVSRLETCLMDATDRVLGRVPWSMKSSFNQQSAIAAVHEMYGAEKWEVS